MGIKPSKRAIETIKTVTIAVLVTAIAMFIAGMAYAESQNAKLNNAISEVEQARAETPVKK